jgi:hypothetical protein
MPIRISQKVNRAFGFAEHVAIYLCALHREEGAQLLGGLQDSNNALALFNNLISGDSGTRQAALTKEFGLRGDAQERVHALIVESPPLLRSAIAKALPQQMRVRFPHLDSSVSISAAIQVLAERLVREAMRL